MNARVLVVDDKENIRKLLEKVLEGTADVKTAADGRQALGMLAAGDFDVVLSDIRMPELDGMTLLREAKAAYPDVEVVLMTGYGSVTDAVAAMKQGAYDYLSKPFEPDEALLVVQRAVERKRLREQARTLKAAVAGVGNLVGESTAMQRVFELVRRAASSDATVLVMGESGTGKELVARAIHDGSERKDGPFIAVNCGALPENLIESELFGHTKGSFTGAQGDKRGLFEEAAHGSIFLDEVGDLPLQLQVKLTRVLQEHAVRRVGAAEERKVDVRVMAATNVDLKSAVAAGRFREDLFYRLNIFPIRLPPLRDRRDDIPLLAMSFLDRHGSRLRNRPEGFTADALTALVRYDWPGNVRELENVVQRALAVLDGTRVGLGDLPEEVSSNVSARGKKAPKAASLSYRDYLELARERASRDYLVDLLDACEGNVTRAAEKAGLQRESLHRLLKRHGLRSEQFKPDGKSDPR